MSVLVDTNVLLRMAAPAHPHHEIATRALEILADRGEDLIVVPQCLYEFWVAATRPVEQNGLGIEPLAAESELDRIALLARLIDDPPNLYAESKRLVVTQLVRGKTGHDARLVAAMHLNVIPAILTFNHADFTRYADITVLVPAQIVFTS